MTLSDGPAVFSSTLTLTESPDLLFPRLVVVAGRGIGSSSLLSMRRKVRLIDAFLSLFSSDLNNNQFNYRFELVIRPDEN